MNDTTPEQNAKRVIELSEKAEPGPWGHHPYVEDGRVYRDMQGPGMGIGRINTWPLKEPNANADFIAECRTAAPELARAYLKLETELQQLRLAADGMAKERNELSRSIEEAHHVAMIDWPGSEVPLLSQVESLFSALKEHYNAKIEAMRTVADGLRDALVECRKDTLFIHARNPQFEEPAKRHAEASAALAAYRAAGEGAPKDTGTSRE